MNFSERAGLTKRTVQFRGMTDQLKNRLWNVAGRIFWDRLRSSQPAKDIYEGQLLLHLAEDFFGMPKDDDEPLIKNVYQRIKGLALALEWERFYDFLEFIAKDHSAQLFLGQTAYVDKEHAFTKACNQVLQEELAGYRFIGLQLAPITNDGEVTAIEDSIAHSDRFAPVSIHIKTALARLSDRPQPDCRNSIKESISAVEAACKIIAADRKATLGPVLKSLSIHPALEKGFGAIYGYTSDSDGIRHALLENPNLNVDDARFFLISCSAFVNYLIVKSV